MRDTPPVVILFVCLSHVQGLSTAKKSVMGHALNNDVCHCEIFGCFITILAMFRDVLREFPIFQGFTESQLDVLVSAFEDFDYPSGTHIFEQGQAAHYLYILTEGKVIIRYKPFDGPQLTVATINPGGVFGWSAAIGRTLYSSGALTVEDSRGYRISKARLVELCAENPETSAVLLKHLAVLVNNPMDPAHAEVLKILDRGIKRNGNCNQRMVQNGR